MPAKQPRKNDEKSQALALIRRRHGFVLQKSSLIMPAFAWLVSLVVWTLNHAFVQDMHVAAKDKTPRRHLAISGSMLLTLLARICCMLSSLSEHHPILGPRA